MSELPDPVTEAAKELVKQLPVKALYKDALSPAVKQTGTALEDLVKVVRLLLAPVHSILPRCRIATRRFSIARCEGCLRESEWRPRHKFLALCLSQSGMSLRAHRSVRCSQSFLVDQWTRNDKAKRARPTQSSLGNFRLTKRSSYCCYLNNTMTTFTRRSSTKRPSYFLRAMTLKLTRFLGRDCPIQNGSASIFHLLTPAFSIP